nr:hypothetical protein [uncultured Holophaga sp.]
MADKTLKRLDLGARILLWAWVLMVLGTLVSGRLSQGRLVLDIAAWVAFGGAMLLSWLPRWLNEIDDAQPIGPVRIWMAAGLAALVITMATSFIILPKIRNHEAVLALAQAPGTAHLLAKAGSAFIQMLVLRLLLAAGMGYAVTLLPLHRAPGASEVR